jgi:hypothetical protein
MGQVNIIDAPRLSYIAIQICTESRRNECIAFDSPIPNLSTEGLFQQLGLHKHAGRGGHSRQRSGQ